MAKKPGIWRYCISVNTITIVLVMVERGGIFPQFPTLPLEYFSIKHPTWPIILIFLYPLHKTTGSYLNYFTAFIPRPLLLRFTG